MITTEQLLSQLPGDSLGGLRRLDDRWRAYTHGQIPNPTVVRNDSAAIASPDWDVVVCGGTLGIMVGCALAQRGWRVAVVERGILRGREQEWNISRQELGALVRVGLLSAAEVEQAIATAYNPARIRFGEGPEFWVTDVLNIGVDPITLLDLLKQRFLAAGGQIFEQCSVDSLTVHANGVAIAMQGDNPSLTARLVLDAMGHFSPIALQARGGRRPDAACLVVGTCATGYPDNPTGDLFVSTTPIQHQCQYFWEAFPARDGRTTYLFTYVDLHPDRPGLAALFDDYLRLLPDYQGIDLEQLTWKRALFGFFPCYRSSPLRSPWDRIVAVGDSSGSQSPLSFGGFGNLIRHLERLTTGLHSALAADLLSRSALAWLQPYQPSLSVTWLFQKSMSVGMETAIAPEQINTLLSAVFQEMSHLGDPVLKPFLQDVVQFPGLFQTLLRTGLFHAPTVAKIVPQVGIPALLDWSGHYLALALYTGLFRLGTAAAPALKSLPDPQRYYLQRLVEAWQYGSGQDYHPPHGSDRPSV
jgi:lycopene cyclase CruP